jgi:hypothetical protein
LIRAIDGAPNTLLALEDLAEQDLDRIRASYTQLAPQARAALRQGQRETGSPEVENG